MPRRQRPLSVFAALPHEMRQRIRSQTVDTWGTDAEAESSSLASPSISQLLPTQPPAPPSPVSLVSSGSSSTSALDAPVVASSSAAVSMTVVSASSSTGVVRSIRRSPAWPSTAELERNSKRRKGNSKSKGKDAGHINAYEGHPYDCTGLVPRYTDAAELPADLRKYWWQRHKLFPLYSDLPLLLDNVGWFSVTPHVIAQNIADRCRGDVVLDAFCGVGGNAIEFARTCEHVIAMDIDPTRLRLARHNALHHGVADRIEFILCDYVEFARSFPELSSSSASSSSSSANSSSASASHLPSAPSSAPMSTPRQAAIDVVFLSPPWGGPAYLSSSTYYPLSAVEPVHGAELFQLTRRITPNIAYYLPRNVDVFEVAALAPPRQGGAPGVASATGATGATGATEIDREVCEVQEEWVGDKLKAVTVYYGGLVADE